MCVNLTVTLYFLALKAANTIQAHLPLKKFIFPDGEPDRFVENHPQFLGQDTDRFWRTDPSLIIGLDNFSMNRSGSSLKIQMTQLKKQT